MCRWGWVRGEGKIEEQSARSGEFDIRSDDGEPISLRDKVNMPCCVSPLMPEVGDRGCLGAGDTG